MSLHVLTLLLFLFDFCFSCSNDTIFWLPKEKIKCKSNYDFLCDIPIFHLPGITCKKDEESNVWKCSNPQKYWIRSTELHCPEDITLPCDYGRCRIQFNPIYTVYFLSFALIVFVFCVLIIICAGFLCYLTHCFFKMEVKSPSFVESQLKIKKRAHVI